MAYKRKTRDEWQLLADYGYGDGWEILCADDTYKSIRQTLKEYRENEGGQYKIVCKRIKIEKENKP